MMTDGGWIGLSDQWEEGNWQSYDKRDVAFVPFWAPGEPNSYGGVEEDCVNLSKVDGNQMNDIPCDVKRSFICQY